MLCVEVFSSDVIICISLYFVVRPTYSNVWMLTHNTIFCVWCLFILYLLGILTYMCEAVIAVFLLSWIWFYDIHVCYCLDIVGQCPTLSGWVSHFCQHRSQFVWMYIICIVRSCPSLTNVYCFFIAVGTNLDVVLGFDNTCVCMVTRDITKNCKNIENAPL